MPSKAEERPDDRGKQTRQILSAVSNDMIISAVACVVCSLCLFCAFSVHFYCNGFMCGDFLLSLGDVVALVLYLLRGLLHLLLFYIM